MSARQLLSVTNIMFVVAGIYFIGVGALGEGSPYVAIAAVFCFVATALGAKKDLVVASPWRTATAALAIILFLGQIIANATSVSVANPYLVVSTIINGVLLVLFTGVLLSTSHEMMRKSSSEEQEEDEKEKKQTKKITYQV